MPYVETAIDIAAPARAIYELAKDMERYPEFMPDVEVVKVLKRDGNTTTTRWKTLVEEAPIEWTEVDVFDDARNRIDYRLIEGDLDKFEGAWTFEEQRRHHARGARRRLRLRRADIGRAHRSDVAEKGRRELAHDAHRAQRREPKRVNTRSARPHLRNAKEPTRPLLRLGSPRSSPALRKFGFLVHPLSYDDVERYDPGAVGKGRPIIKKILEWIPPYRVSDIAGVRSEATGEEIDRALHRRADHARTVAGVAARRHHGAARRRC